MDAQRQEKDGMTNEQHDDCRTKISEWEGDPEHLAGHLTDHLLSDEHLCDEAFASKHEAFTAGFVLGNKVANS